VDTDRFSPVSPDRKLDLRNMLELPSDMTIAIFSGRLVPGKQVDRLLVAWEKLQKDYPRSVLVIAGSGEEENRLRQLAGGNVRFVGQVDDVVPYLQASDIFVLPSAAEGLSNAMLEALAVGLACVATSVGGTPDVIEDGVNGLLIPPEEPDELQSALAKLLADDALRCQIGQQARGTIQERYSLERTANKLVSLYTSLLKRDD